MAVLTSENLRDLRRTLRDIRDPASEVDFTKGNANDAFQAMEDWYQAHKVDGNTRVDTATSPYVFSNPDKKLIGAAYFNWRFLQDK